MLLWWPVGWFDWVHKACQEYFIAHFGGLFLGKKKCYSFYQVFWKLLYCIVNLKKIANFSGYFCKLYHKI
jgi:hypothetical protein